MATAVVAAAAVMAVAEAAVTDRSAPRLAFTRERTGQQTAVHVRISRVHGGFCYRCFRAGGPFQWPVGCMLIPPHSSMENLG